MEQDVINIKQLNTLMNILIGGILGIAGAWELAVILHYNGLGY